MGFAVDPAAAAGRELDALALGLGPAELPGDRPAPLPETASAGTALIGL